MAVVSSTKLPNGTAFAATQPEGPMMAAQPVRLHAANDSASARAALVAIMGAAHFLRLRNWPLALRGGVFFLFMFYFSDQKGLTFVHWRDQSRPVGSWCVRARLQGLP